MVSDFERAVLEEFTSIVNGAGSRSGMSGGSSASALASVFKSGFGLSPLIGGIISLFSGGDSEPPARPSRYQLPPALEIRRAQTRTGTYDLEYDQSGRARALGAPDGSNQATGTPQVTVNIQAMDARSFLDRSNDIAAAVRDAMLNLNSLNDIIADL